MAGSSRKRAIDHVISISDSDDDVQITGSQPRKNPRLPDVPIGNSNGDEEFDEGAQELDEIVDPSQDYNDRAFILFMLYGTLHTKIVGVRYYRGHATMDEMVMLRTTQNLQ